MRNPRFGELAGRRIEGRGSRRSVENPTGTAGASQEKIHCGHRWKHDDLLADLSSHLVGESRMVWTDMQLGPQGSPRPDVYTIERSYVRPNPTAYEVKISVSDFRVDITAGKWSKYLDYAHAVVFACPVGMISKTDVPEMCGLMVRYESGWRYAKKATINPRPIAQAALLKLLIDGVTREGPKMRAKFVRDVEGFTRKFGSVAARYVYDAATAQDRIDGAEHRAKMIIDRAEAEARRMHEAAQSMAPELWQRLIVALGLPPDADRWQVEAAIRSVEQSAAGGTDAANMRSVMRSLSRLVNQYGDGE